MRARGRWITGLTGTLLLSLLVAAPVDAARPLDLRNAPVPAGMCDHPAGHLANGMRDFGFSGSEGLDWVRQGTVLGGATAAGIVGCTAGGVGWPEYLLLYRGGPGGKPYLVASTSLGILRSSEHVGVNGIWINGGYVRIVARSYNGCCFETQTITASLRVRNGKVVITRMAKGPIENPYS